MLRGLTLADFHEGATMWADPEVTRFIGGRPFTFEESWARLHRNVGHWALQGYGYWAVRDRSGQWVGEVGFADWHRELSPPLDAPEAGWVLARSAHGQGYATEALRRALEWAEQHFGHRRSTCIIDPSNDASVNVARKCGFVPRADAVYKGSRVLVFARGD